MLVCVCVCASALDGSQAPRSSKSDPSATSGTPSKLSFVDIVRMVEQGQQPPGIKDIPDVLSASATVLQASALGNSGVGSSSSGSSSSSSGSSGDKCRAAAPAKPWELAPLPAAIPAVVHGTGAEGGAASGPRVGPDSSRGPSPAQLPATPAQLPGTPAQRPLSARGVEATTPLRSSGVCSTLQAPPIPDSDSASASDAGGDGDDVVEGEMEGAGEGVGAVASGGAVEGLWRAGSPNALKPQ